MQATHSEQSPTNLASVDGHENPLFQVEAIYHVLLHELSIEEDSALFHEPLLKPPHIKKPRNHMVHNA